MKKLILSLSFLLGMGGFPVLKAADTIAVQETRIPVLIDRADNELFDLRINSTDGKVLNTITVTLGKDVNLKEIKAVKLYYAGTDGMQHAGKTHFRPVDYLPRSLPGDPRCANLSYSILKAMKEAPTAAKIVLKVDQKLFPGVNYFWVSLQMKKNTSLLSKVSAEITSAILGGKEAVISYAQKAETHRMGIGVRCAGDDGVDAYRIPGLATSNKGTLLGVYDVRYNSSVDLQEYVDVGLSRSTDGGHTWEKMRLPLAFGEYGGLPKAQNGVGDPAILVDKKTGAIWIVAVWTHGMGNGRAWFNSDQGMDLSHTAQLVMTKSEDDGKTWSAPINVTDQVKDPSWYFLLQGPGNGISMENGTLVFAAQYIDADRIPNACIIYSADHGKTWKISTLARTNTTEAQVAEVEPGVLMLNMRDNRGGSRAVATTEDMGKTWREHVSSRSALPESVCMASLIKVAAKDNVLNKDILLFSNPNTTKGRHSITIKASLDGGVTWLPEHQVLLDSRDGWGYSCLSMINPMSVGILYESSVAHMAFQAVKLTDIIPQK